MNHVTTDSLVTLTEASKTLVPGRPSPSTLWRWCRKGCRGVHLKYQRFGHKIYTWPGALTEFTDALAALDRSESTSAPLPPVQKQKTVAPAARRKAIDDANKILVAAGI